MGTDIPISGAPMTVATATPPATAILPEAPAEAKLAGAPAGTAPAIRWQDASDR